MRWRRDDDLGLRDRYPSPGTVWGDAGYMAAHERFLCDMLDDEQITERFASGRRLPRDYGVGLDERVVEYPWVFSRTAGHVMDAGSALNHAHVLDRLLPRIAGLHVVTLAPEPVSFVDRAVSYVFSDLRDLPYRNGCFDTVVSVSTLEHVGMDNSRYGDPRPPAEEPRDEVRRAAGELRRVVRAGGQVLVTVPYGRREDHGWFCQFDERDVGELVETLQPARASVTVFAYSARGWQPSSLREAREVSYHDAGELQRPGTDLAVAARAVACVAAGF